MERSTLLIGDQVRLAAIDPEKDAERFAQFTRDSEYFRLDATDPARAWSARQVKVWQEEDEQTGRHTSVSFAIRARADDLVIGFVGLDGIEWTHGNAWVGIGIGDRAYWDRGYGTDAMRVMLRYAFMELNLYRISLNVFGYNPRAIRSYEKCGFVHEGCLRQYLHREGRLWDLIHMGILREEWERANPM